MTAAAQLLTVRVPLAVRKPRGGRKLILTPGAEGMVIARDLAQPESADEIVAAAVAAAKFC